MIGNKAVLDAKGERDDSTPKQKLANDKVKSAKEFQDVTKSAAVKAKRAAQAAMDGIPVDGARQILRQDPVTKGKELFDLSCSVCHAYTPSGAERAQGNDGFTKEGAKDPDKIVFKASDLGGWGTKEWIKGLLDNPGHDKYFGLTKLDGMKRWRKGVERERAKYKPDEARKRIAEDDAELAAIAELLADQANPRRSATLSWRRRKSLTPSTSRAALVTRSAISATATRGPT